jgi:hypothetical protein
MSVYDGMTTAWSTVLVEWLESGGRSSKTRVYRCYLARLIVFDTKPLSSKVKNAKTDVGAAI